MPIIHNKQKLHKLLIDNNINPNDAVARGKFYVEYFNWDDLAEQYRLGKSIRDISRLTNLSYDAIRTNLIRVLGNLRNFSVKDKSNYYFKEELFTPRVTKIGAYFLGWMYSDGCVTPNKLTITLQHRDKEQVKYLASLVSNKSTRTVKNGESFDFYSVSISSMLSNDYNVIPNKSHVDIKIPFEKFDIGTLPYLLLGLIEGDGSISAYSSQCTMLLSNNSWKMLKEILSKDLNLNMTHVNSTVINDFGLTRISFSGLSYYDFLYYIYTNTRDVKCLERKFSLFRNQIERSMNGKTSPYKKLAVKLWDSLNCNTK